MAVGIATATRTAMATALLNALDANAAPGKLRLYTGPRPATGGAATTLLAELTLSRPCGTVANGVLTFGAIAPDDQANATGTVVWARLVDGAGNFVMDLGVTLTGGGGEVQINSTAISVGQQIIAPTATVTIGGA